MEISKNTYNEALENIRLELQQKLTSKELAFISTGEIETITKVLKITFNADLYDFLVELSNKKSYYLYKANNKAFEISDEIINILNSYSEDLNKVRSAIDAATIDTIVKAEEDRLAKKRAEEEAAHQEKIERMVNQVQSIYNKSKKQKISEVESFYLGLGWLTKNIGTISASLPDYMGPWFEKAFGTEAPKTLVDTSYKSEGGFERKFSLAFSISVKDNTYVPAIFYKQFKNKKKINDTAFVFDLIEHYGFKFGKTQTIEDIIATVPEIYRVSFNEGYNG